MNVYENIVLPIKLDGIKPDNDYIEEILKLLKLEDKKYFMPNQLSGGQQQRVALARALAIKEDRKQTANESDMFQFHFFFCPFFVTRLRVFSVVCWFFWTLCVC